jgi:phosphoglycerate dehydrogenase-like enzyme
LLLALARGIAPALQGKERREWRGGAAIELTGGVLGVIGMGGFGAETIKRAAGYDLKIIALDPVLTEPLPGVDELRTPDRDNLHDLLRRADAVVVACPLTEETYHLIGREQLALMKNSAYLINVTRGGIIDEDALATALKNEEIAGAGLDVFETEPLPADSPLWDAPNLIITPHRAGASQHRPRKIFEFFCQQLARYLQGERPLNIVDTTRGF